MDGSPGGVLWWQGDARVEVDYLVVGAGAMGMGFIDALIDHADVRVAMVDRRHGVGGHWLQAYPFVRLHQSSTFYGVASHGARRRSDPDSAGPRPGCTSGRTSRRSAPTTSRCWPSGWSGRDGSSSSPVASTSAVGRSSRGMSGERFEVPERCRIVDARYLAPDIPAETPPKFEVAEGVRVIPVNDLPAWRGRPASTSSWARARPRRTPASGCWAAASTPTRSAGCGRATRGC